jgi:hypothetical protein
VKLEILDQELNMVHPLIELFYENAGDHYKRIQTRKLKSGIYMIRMTTDDRVYLDKMMVM